MGPARGRILSGRHEGWDVLVQDDTSNTGGFLILITHGKEGYDGWVESQEDIEEYFKEAGWIVEWASEEN